MFKRLISVLVVLTMLLSFASCGGEETSSSAPASQEAQESSSEEIPQEYEKYINADGTISFPNLVGMKREDAQNLLKAIGLKYYITKDYSSDVDADCVISADYKEGEKVEKGKYVMLTVRKEGDFIAPDTPYTDPLVAQRGELPKGANKDYKPINYETMKAVWLSQFDMNQVYNQGTQRSEEEFRQLFSQACLALMKDGYNTVIVQVRPNGDSFYPSQYYPWSSYVVGAYGCYGIYDPLQIMIEEAHKLELSFQAWINPMRAYRSKSVFNVINVNYPIRNWFDDPQKYPNYVFECNGTYYLNVAHKEVRQLIIDGAAEIARYYDVDGIHMDDYFYPTGIDRMVDLEQFRDSGLTSLVEFRKSNVNKLVKGLYDAVKAENPNMLFGISPAGNIDNVRNKCCLDVDTILSRPGYVDYIMPQIYWGFNHSSQPYATCLASWCSLVKNDSISFMVGLTTANISNPTDSEFVNNKDVFARYITTAQSSGYFSGFCVFSYASLYNPMTGTPATSVKEEMANFLPVIQSISSDRIKY